MQRYCFIPFKIVTSSKILNGIGQVAHNFKDLVILCTIVIFFNLSEYFSRNIWNFFAKSNRSQNKQGETFQMNTLYIIKFGYFSISSFFK